ncbi:MAG: anti-sigma factor domain-containing protein [Microthrixaceae bacterium]
MTPLTHDEAAELLGAYALHAVEPAERALVEAHLDACPRCRDELRGHVGVAAMLGNSGGDAPDGVWDRIVGSLEEVPPPLRLSLSDDATVVPLAARRRERGGRVAIAVAGAAAAVTIGVLGVKVVQQGDEIDRVRSALGNDAMLAAANLALVDPRAIETELVSPDGSVTASAVVLPDGTGYLLARDLPGLPPDRTYQLWGQTSGGLISLGVLGSSPGQVVAFRASGDVAALAITDEVAGGVSQSKNAPALIGRFD